MLRPLNTLGGVPSSSIISRTLLVALLSFKEAMQTSATKSLEISPEFKVSSALIDKAPTGDFACKPPAIHV